MADKKGGSAKVNFEELFFRAFAEVIGSNGGSIETALDNIRITDEKTRQKIKNWFGWDEE